MTTFDQPASFQTVLFLDLRGIWSSQTAETVKCVFFCLRLVFFFSTSWDFFFVFYVLYENMMMYRRDSEMEINFVVRGQFGVGERTETIQPHPRMKTQRRARREDSSPSVARSNGGGLWKRRKRFAIATSTSSRTLGSIQVHTTITIRCYV